MTQEPSPHSGTIAALIELHQARLQLTDQHLSEALGYTAPTVLGLIKTGRMKLPMNKVVALAEALELEPGHVMRTLLIDTAPDMLKCIEDCMGPLSLSPAEKRLIAALRTAANGREVAPIFMDGTPIVAMIVG